MRAPSGRSRRLGDRRRDGESGKLADLVVLSADYMTIPDKQVESLKAMGTYVGGKLVYHDPGFNP